MTTPLHITTGREPDGTPILKAVGEIDMTNAATLATALDDNSGRVVIDLTEVEYLDSAGLNVLFAHADRIDVIATPLIGRVITISGLPTLANVRGLAAADSDGDDGQVSATDV